MADNTLGPMRRRVSRMLGDLNQKVWSVAEIRRYLREGYHELLTSTECRFLRVATDDVAGEATVTLPAAMYKVTRVTWGGRKIVPVDLRDLRRYDVSYLTQEGDVHGWVFEGDGQSTIRKIRIPAVNAANKFAIEGVSRGTTLSTPGTLLEIPERYCRYVEFYAVGKCLEREGDGQDLELAKHFMARYGIGKARIRERMSRTRAARAGVIGGDASILHPGRPPRPRLPDNFPDRRRRY